MLFTLLIFLLETELNKWTMLNPETLENPSGPTVIYSPYCPCAYPLHSCFEHTCECSCHYALILDDESPSDMELECNCDLDDARNCNCRDDYEGEERCFCLCHSASEE